MISSIMRFVTIKYNVQFEFVDQKTPISWTVHHRLAHDFDKTVNFYALDGFDYDDSKKKTNWIRNGFLHMGTLTRKYTNNFNK